LFSLLAWAWASGTLVSQPGSAKDGWGATLSHPVKHNKVIPRPVVHNAIIFMLPFFGVKP
jgi:hypothetical protein